MTNVQPFPHFVAIGAGLLILWLASGLMTALVAAAFVDLALSIVEWRRRRPPIELPRERS